MHSYACIRSGIKLQLYARNWKPVATFAELGVFLTPDITEAPSGKFCSDGATSTQVSVE